MVADDTASADRAVGRFRRFVDWVLLDGNRLVVAGLVVGVALVVDPLVPLTSRNAAPLFYAFSALIGGNLNLLTVVVSINQLILSRELKSPRAYREELAGIDAFREDVATAVGRDTAPTSPVAFVRPLVDAIERDGEAVEEAAAGTGDADLAALGTDLREALADDLDDVRSSLGEGRTAPYAVVSALLAVDFARHHERVGRVRAGAGASSGDLAAAADRLESRIELLDVTREHCKQLFTRENLSNMSRMLLYVGVPVEGVLVVVLVGFVGVFGPAPLGPASPGLVYAAAVSGLAPLAVVFAYVLRAATIERRTASTKFTTAADSSDRAG